MLPYIYLGILLINLITFICYNRYGKALQLFTLLFIILFMAGLRYNVDSYVAHDQVNYAYNYMHPENIGNYAIGYKFINIVFNRMGISFDAFYWIVVITTTIAIAYGAFRISGNSVIISIVFLLYYILVAVDLIRNACAFAIYINIFPLLFSERRKDRWIYLIGVVISATIHISFILYMMLLLKDINLKSLFGNKFFKVFSGVVIVAFVAIFAFGLQSAVGKIANGLISLLSFDSQERYLHYSTRSTHLSSLVPFCIYIIVLFGMIIWSKDNEQGGIKMGKRILATRKDVLAVYYFSSAFLLLAFISTEFFRICRDVSILMIVFLGYSKIPITVKKRLSFLIVILSVCIGWFVLDIVLKGQWSNYLEFYFQNSIFGW